jgi:hypothetical protein
VDRCEQEKTGGTRGLASLRYPGAGRGVFLCDIYDDRCNERMGMFEDTRYGYVSNLCRFMLSRVFQKL